MDRADVAVHGTGCEGVYTPRAGTATIGASGRIVYPVRNPGESRAGESSARAGGPGDAAASDGARHHRPALFADLTELIDATGTDWSASSRAEVAAATAAVVVQAGRTPGDAARFVSLADQVGLDTLAALWRDADPVSLPGALWALYLLRQWCQFDGEEVTRLWRLGEVLAPADAAISGVPDYADAAAIRDLADAVLVGVYQGDLAVALERAAAFFRVVATGRRSLVQTTDAFDAAGAGDTESVHGASPQDDVEPAIALAVRNERVAAALSAAARRWRAGTLN